MPVKKTKTVFVFLSLASILFSVFSVLIAPQMASAAVQGEWVDFATIKVGDQLYKDGKPRDSSHDYYLNGNTGDCSSEIDAFEGNKVGATKAKITLKNKDPLTGNCTQSTDTINLSQPLNATIQFYWVDSGTIEGAWSGDGMYKKLPDRNDFALQTNDECKNSVVPSSANATTGVYVIRGQVQTPDPNDSPLNKTCGEESRIDVRIGNAEANASKPPGSGTPTNGGSGSETADDSPSCETASGGSPLVWLICPVIKMLDEAASWLDNQVQSLLVVQNPDSIEEGGVNQLKNAWGRIRNIALIILVPMMLVMVISTALGFSIVDAYTLKKVMPRFLIAVLFISTSFYLMDFLVTITNDVGRGVLGLVTQPFGGSDQTLVDLMSPAAGASLSWGGFLVFGGLALAGLVSFGIILSLAFVTVVALAMGFGILILRQVLILGLLLLAPLAILSWIFPNSVKGWKLWWGSFSKLLLMFPLIMLLIGAGRAFAQIIDGMQVGGEAMQQVMILLAYIAPFFFIPATFKAAGGVFGTIAGMANDRTRGLFDKQRQYRTDQQKELRERAGMGRRFNPTSRLGRRFNKLSGALADPLNTARIATGSPRGRALVSELTQKSAQQSQELAKWMSQTGFNQEALTTIMTVASQNGGRVTKDGLQAGIQRLRAAGGTQNMAGADQLEQSAAFLEETWRNEDFGRAHVGMAAGLAKAQQGFLNSENADELASYSNYLNREAPGLGNTFKTQAGLLNSQAGGLTKVGYSEQVTPDGRIVAGGQAARAIQASRTSVQELSGAKSSQIRRHFIDNGAFGAILDADTSSDATATITDAATGERIRVTEGRKAALLDTIAQAAYGYNTPAETAEVLRGHLDSVVGDVRTVTETVSDPRARGGTRSVTKTVNADGSELSSLQRMALDARARASRDPSLFGGLDRQPRPPEE